MTTREMHCAAELLEALDRLAKIDAFLSSVAFLPKLSVFVSDMSQSLTCLESVLALKRCAATSSVLPLYVRTLTFVSMSAESPRAKAL